MEWMDITDGRLKAYAYDDEGNDWEIYFDGYNDCEGSPLHGNGVRLSKNNEAVATFGITYNGDVQAFGWNADAAIAASVGRAKSLAAALILGDEE